jgi:hypothetical protein
MVAFGTKRLAENVERNHTLLGCEEPEQVMRVQSEFIGQATKQYLDQVNTVINLVNDMTHAMWAPFGVTPLSTPSPASAWSFSGNPTVLSILDG